MTLLFIEGKIKVSYSIYNVNIVLMVAFLQLNPNVIFSLTYQLRNLTDWVRDRSVTSEERKAFFINLYNCLMIDALADCSVPKSGDEGPEKNLPVSPLKVNIILRLLKQIEFYFPIISLLLQLNRLLH